MSDFAYAALRSLTNTCLDSPRNELNWQRKAQHKILLNKYLMSRIINGRAMFASKVSKSLWKLLVKTIIKLCKAP